MTTVYRVDNELLTIAEVDKQSLHADTPLNVWLPVVYGCGEYCYYEDEQEAKESLYRIIDKKIVALREIQASIFDWSDEEYEE